MRSIVRCYHQCRWWPSRALEARVGRVGADASVALISVGANHQIDTRNFKAPVIGFVLTNRGVMDSLSLDGTRVWPMDL